MIYIVPATTEDAYSVAVSIRPADALEVARSSGDTPLEACKRSLEASWFRFAAIENGRAIAIFGVADHPRCPTMGIIWMLATPRAEQLQYRLGRESRRFLKRAKSQHWAMLYNYIDADNTRSRKWLKWLGFVEGEPVPYGVGQTPFIPFVLQR